MQGAASLKKNDLPSDIRDRRESIRRWEWSGATSNPRIPLSDDDDDDDGDRDRYTTFVRLLFLVVIVVVNILFYSFVLLRLS